MAYVGTDTNYVATGKRTTVRKRKPKLESTFTRSDGPSASGSKLGNGGYTSVNTTSNARSGQAYRTQAGNGGVYHVYATGERVFVKKKKNANPSRSFN